MTESLEVRSVVDAAVFELKAAGALEVYLFGSAAHGGTQRPSDVDLAVKGLTSGVFFKVYGQLLYKHPMRIDLIDLDQPSHIVRHLQNSDELVRVG